MAQSLTRGRGVGAITLDPSAARPEPSHRSRDHLLPLDRRDLHRHLSALLWQVLCVLPSLPWEHQAGSTSGQQGRCGV